jgi:hypothetical protein
VAFLREPNFFLTADVQGTFVQSYVGRLDNRVIGVGTRAIRPSYINGQRCDAGYLADLRLRREYRGGTFVARAYRFLREIHADGRVEIYSTVIVDDNRVALQTVAANRAGLPPYTPLGRIFTPAIHLGRRFRPLGGEIVRGSVEMLPDIVVKLNENRLQFAPGWSEEDFLSGRLHGFRIDDFYVLRRGPRISGVLGVWDQRSFRQTVVMSYGGWLGRLRPLINLVRRPPLPCPGSPVPFFYIAFVSTDDSSAFAALFRRVYNDHCRGEYSHCIIGLHENDPRVSVLNGYPQTRFAGQLFAVSFEGPPVLDGRVPYVEAALL